LPFNKFSTQVNRVQHNEKARSRHNLTLYEQQQEQGGKVGRLNKKNKKKRHRHQHNTDDGGQAMGEEMRHVQISR